MSWRELLHDKGETIILPWLGGRALRSLTRMWTIVGDLPREHGWYTFKLLAGRSATVENAADPGGLTGATCVQFQYGYLVGDRFATEDFSSRVQPEEAAQKLPRVHLIDDTVDRFARVSVGRVHDDGPLIFRQVEMPLGSEDEVLRAFEDRAENVAHIKGVTPALDAAFRMESWQRTEAERRRVELERLRREEEERRAREERRVELIKKLGDGAGRRVMAKLDFEPAARAALIVGGAELLSWVKSRYENEYTVRYRVDGERYECVCDDTLHIVDAGICLNNYETGEKGDTWFTLESLPAVVREGQRRNVIVRFRRV